MNYLITGNSRGLGLALTETALSRGNKVFGLSRRGNGLEHPMNAEMLGDIGQLEAIPGYLDKLLGGVTHLDVVVLNAGVLGTIATMRDSSLDSLNETMTINVWANKVILDWIQDKSIQVDQVIMISSGAGVRGNKGWGGYALSKATLNMLAQLYAAEMENTHFVALAPGIIDTAMQARISDPGEIDIEIFPSFSSLRDARASNAMPTADEAAQKIFDSFESLKDFASGSTLDIRNF